MLFVIVPSLFSQDLDESLFELEDFEERELVERLERLREDPLDLNTASLSEILQIPWLYPALARRILLMRKQLGGFDHLSQLKEIPGMTQAIFGLITPYLQVRPVEKVRITAKRKKPFGKGRFRARVIHKRPLKNGKKYVGNSIEDSIKVYTRLDFEPRENFSFGLLTEKDHGEESYTDLLNYHFEWKNGGTIEKIILGHYELEFGEGLLFSSSSFIFKGSGIIKGSEKGLRPYRSSNENGGLHGGAITSNFGPLDLSLFASLAELDGTLNEDGTVRSLYEEGVHRDSAEIAKKDQVREELFGGRIAFSSKKVKVGMTGYTGSYDPPFKPEDSPRYAYAFERKRFTLVGADFEIPLRDFDLFGEVGYSLNRGWGSVLGILYHLNPVDAAFLFRHYEEDFYSPHSSGFSNSDDENEVGSFAQLSYRLSSKTKVRGYLDLFRYPQRRFFEDLPTEGREFRGEVEHQLRNDLSLIGRVSQKGRERYTSEDGKIHWRERRGIRITGKWAQSKKLDWFGRVEVLEALIPDLEEKEDGNLLFGGFRFRPFKRTSIDGRLIFFHTDSYESRIYEFERDLPGVMTNLALFGKGRRFYLVMNHKIAKFLRLSGKFSTTYKEKSSVETYGVQMDWKW